MAVALVSFKQFQRRREIEFGESVRRVETVVYGLELLFDVGVKPLAEVGGYRVVLVRLRIFGGLGLYELGLCGLLL